MRVVCVAGWVVGLFVCLTGANAAAAPKAVPIAVLDFQVERNVDESLVRMLNEMLLTEIAQSGRFQVFGGSDIRAMLQLEGQKDTFGCDEDSCLAEVGAALGVDLLLSGSLGKIGSRFILNMKVINTREAKVVARWGTREADEDALLTGLSRGVASIIGSLGGGQRRAPKATDSKPSGASHGAPGHSATTDGAAVKAALAARQATSQTTVETDSLGAGDAVSEPGAQEPSVHRSSGSTLAPAWVPWAALGLGAASAGLAAWSGQRAADTVTDRDSASTRPEYQELHDQAAQQALISSAAIVIAVASAGTAGGLWLWDLFAPGEEPTASFILAPSYVGLTFKY